MSKRDDLLAQLARCDENSSNQYGHSEADYALLVYIDDPEITAAYEKGAEHWWWS